MPRTIADIEYKILASASRLFLEKGYAGVTMSQIAAEAGTSVGNLYNYYPAKKDLFLAGRRIWFEFWNEELSSDVEDGDPQGGLEAALLSMMGGIAKWSGLWEEFLAVLSREIDRDELAALKAQLRADLHEIALSRVDDLARRAAKDDPAAEKLLKGTGKRLATVLVMMLKTLAIFYPGEPERNEEFVRAMLPTLFRPRTPSVFTEPEA